METEFDLMFKSDADVEQALDDFIDAISDELEVDEAKTTILNINKLKQIKFVYSMLKYLTSGTDAVVSYKLYEPFKTMGSVSVEGKEIEFQNPDWFSKISKFASNIEVYVLAKNKVRLTFTFHGLTAPIE